MSANLPITTDPAHTNEPPPATEDTHEHRLDTCGLTILAAITRAAVAHPQHADTLLHAAPLLAPTSDLLRHGQPQIYVAHVAELLDRIVIDGDLTLPTAAELLVACADMSLRAPLNGRGFALYRTLFCAVLLGHPLASAGDGGDGGDIEELRATLTRAMQRQIARAYPGSAPDRGMAGRGRAAGTARADEGRGQTMSEIITGLPADLRVIGWGILLKGNALRAYHLRWHMGSPLYARPSRAWTKRRGMSEAERRAVPPDLIAWVARETEDVRPISETLEVVIICAGEPGGVQQRSVR